MSIKTNLIKKVVTRVASKNPTFFNILQWIALGLIAVFFGADKVIDLCDVAEFLCRWSSIIYTILLTIAGMAQLPVSDKSKNYDKIK